MKTYDKLKSISNHHKSLKTNLIRSCHIPAYEIKLLSLAFLSRLQDFTTGRIIYVCKNLMCSTVDFACDVKAFFNDFIEFLQDRT